jgi:hypothetical protein
MFKAWFEDHCDDPIDLDLGLIEVRDNPYESWTIRSLAGHSVGMPPEDGYFAAVELLTAITFCADGWKEGKLKLAQILSAPEIDYQRALYFALAGRGPLAMLGDLKRLVDLMQARFRLAEAASAQGLAIKVANSPYLHFDGPDGPQGTFCPDFSLASAWERFAQSKGSLYGS